jgi:hypothetical protein
MEEGRPDHRRSLSLASALQRRPGNQCRLVRVHMFDSLLETMRAVMDPMVLFEEAEDTSCRCRSCRKSSGRTISGPANDGRSALRSSTRRALAAHPAGRASRSRLGRDHRSARGEGTLLSQALLVLQHGRKLSMLSGLPHGLIVLAGPPGTGKTTMARGLAQVSALALGEAGRHRRWSRSTRTRFPATCWARVSATSPGC